MHRHGVSTKLRGSVCRAGLKQPDDFLRAHKDAYHVVYVAIAGDRLTSVGVTPEGEEFDRFTLTLP